MQGDAEIAARDRKRAAEVRHIADSVTDEAAKKALIQVADDYEQMALKFEEAASADRLRRLPIESD